MRRSLAILLLSTAWLLMLGAGCSDEAKTPDPDQGTQDSAAKSDAVNPDQTLAPDQSPGPDQSSTPDTKAGGDTGPACGTCHSLPPSTGQHRRHTNKGYTCNTCHSEVVDSKMNIINSKLHNNGTKNVKGSFTWDSAAKRCSSVPCHGTKNW